MTRTYAVTGAASGIGLATAELLRERGHRVIGIDLQGTEVTSDLSDPSARERLADDVAALCDGTLDGVIAIAGVSALTSLTVKVNYFGAKASLELLRPLLLRSPAPRAAVVASFSTLQEVDADLLSLLEQGDEPAAVERGDVLAASGGETIYASTKRAIAEWIRRAAISADWAGAGIPLNGVGPGIILTPMIAPYMETAEGRAFMNQMVPMPLNGPMDPVVIARTLAWLTSEENSHMAGQIVFVDGGADVSLRGAKVFGEA